MKFLTGNPVPTYCAYFDLKNAEIDILDGYVGPNGGGFLVNNAGTNEIQTVTVTASTGTYTLTFGANTTSNIAYDATATTVQSALRSLASIGLTGVTVSGSAGGPYTVTFVGPLRETDVALLGHTDTNLGGGSVAVVQATPGAPAYAIGVTTMAIDTGTGQWVAGDKFKVNGSEEQTISSATGSPTTSITFTPGLDVNVRNNDVIIGSPHVLHVRLGEGNMTFTEKKAREYKKNRGKLDAVRNGDEDPLEVKLEFAWIFIKSSTGEDITVEDALKQQGNASTWVTAGVDPCEPYAVIIRINYVPPCPDVDDELIDLAEFRYEELQHDTKTGMIACTGKCNLTVPTVTRVPK